MTKKNEAPFLVQLKQIFGPSYFLTALCIRKDSKNGD